MECPWRELPKVFFESKAGRREKETERERERVRKRLRERNTEKRTFLSSFFLLTTCCGFGRLKPNPISTFYERAKINSAVGSS